MKLLTHPMYDINYPDWVYFQDHYRGGPAYIRGDYLKKYQVEPYMAYVNRKSRSFYLNYCQPIIDMYVSHVVRDISRELFDSADNVDTADNQETNRRDLSEAFPVDDIDNMGTPIDEFMKMAATWAATFGHIFVFVDYTKAPQDEDGRTIYPVSKQDERELGMRPYAFPIFPTKMINWSLDRWGKPIFVVWEEKPEDIVLFNESRQNDQQKPNYRVWTREEWKLLDNNGDTIEDGENELKEIPIVFFPFTCGPTPWSSESLIKDIARVNNQIYQWSSALDELILKQAFSILKLKSSRDEKELKLGTNYALPLDPNGDEDAEYIAPDVAPMQQIRDTILEAKTEIYRIAGAARQGGREVGEAESGIAKAFDFDQTNKRLASFADNCQTAETQIWKWFSAWQKTTVEFEVDYPDNFNVMSLSMMVEEALDIKSIGLDARSPELWNQMLKRIALKELGRVDDETSRKIIEQIESGASSAPVGGLAARLGITGSFPGGETDQQGVDIVGDRQR